MADLFVSYASEDRVWVARLVAEFEAQGWTVWWDRQIKPGTSFDVSIEAALHGSKCVVVVWSEASVKSDWVRAEAAEGLERNILIPVLLDGVKPPLLFRQKQAISLIDWKLQGQIDKMPEGLVPSINTILQSYRESSLPVSIQHAWVLGGSVTNTDDDRLALAAHTALDLGLSFFDNLFLYTSEFRGRSTESLPTDQMEMLVDQEGLEGYFYGEIKVAESITFLLHILPTQGTEIVLKNVFADESSLPEIVGECLLQAADVLQGSTPREAERLLVYLKDRNPDSLYHYGLSFHFAAENNYQQVRDACTEAIRLDNSFAQAYRALATAYQYLGQLDEAHEAIVHTIGPATKESERNTRFARAMYYAMYSHDHQNAVKEFEAVIQISPMDQSAINNLAVCYFYLLEFDRAMELSRRDLALYPMKKIGRQNAAFYFLYAGAFEDAESEAKQLFDDDPAYVNALVIEALTLVQRGDMDTAEARLVSGMHDTDRKDAVLFQARADFAIAREDWTYASDLLLAGLDLDRKLGNKEGAARKQLMLAETAFAMDQPERGVLLLSEALADSQSIFTLATAGVLHAMFEFPFFPLVEEAIRKQANLHGRAYARMISGLRAFSTGDYGVATQQLDEALGILDLWLIRFARAYTFKRAGMLLEALDEVAICLSRSGEGVSAALDEQPSYRYLARLQSL